MNILTDSMIYNDYKNLILNNYTTNITIGYCVLALLIYIIIAIIFIIVAIIKRSEASYRDIISKINYIIVIIIFVTGIFAAIFSKFIGNFNINNGIEKMEYTVTIEVLEEKFCYNNRNLKTPYYLVFNNNLLMDSEGKEKEKYQINVKSELFHNVSLGDKMYVVRNYKGYIVLVYSCKDYKYSNDNNLTTN